MNMIEAAYSRALGIALLLCMPLLTGCATYITRTNWHERPGKFYPATRFNAEVIGECTGGESDPMAPMSGICLFVVPPMVVDLPFSVVLDTVLLPVDTFWKDPRNK